MKLTFPKIYVVLAMAAVALSACKKEYETIQELDTKNIQAYIKQNNLSAQEYKTSGIYYQVLQQGTGSALDYSKVYPTVLTVRSLDGGFLGTDTLAYFNRYANYFGYTGLLGVKQNDVIPEIIKTALVNKGGQIRVIIPSRLAFGRNPYTTITGYTGAEIPGNASLDVTYRILDDTKLDQYEEQGILKYLAANSLTGYTKTNDGIYYKISAAGTGTSPIGLDSTLTVNYTGKLLNGQVFDTSSDYITTLSSLVTSWQKIVPMIKSGGSVRFIAPSKYGYGTSGSGSIPAFSSLDFVVSVTKVED